MTIRTLAMLILLALQVACSSPPPPGAPAVTRDVTAEALAAAARGDWAQAAPLLREALRQDSARADLHYQLGVAASHLDRRDEAIGAFQWVVANVARDLPEAAEARSWLIEAGVLPRPRAVTTTTPPDRITEETPGDSGVEGRVFWADGRPTARLQLFLKGAPRTPNETLQWVLRTDEDGRFRFRKIPAGIYMLTNTIAGAPLWRLRIRLEPGETTTVDLSETNNARIRDDFPGA
jgi:hypothetical protein